MQIPRQERFHEGHTTLIATHLTQIAPTRLRAMAHLLVLAMEADTVLMDLHTEARATDHRMEAMEADMARARLDLAATARMALLTDLVTVMDLHMVEDTAHPTAEATAAAMALTEITAPMAAEVLMARLATEAMVVSMENRSHLDSPASSKAPRTKAFNSSMAFTL